MSCYSGPNENTDGLVLCYDMNNTKKSWKGKPTRNLYGDFGTSQNLRSHTRYDWDGVNWNGISLPIIGPNFNSGYVWKFNSGSLSSTWSGNSYGYMYKDIQTTAGVQYTGSFYCYVSIDCNINALPASSEFTGGYASLNLSASYDMSKKGTWQRIGISTTGVGSTSRFLAYPQKYGVTDGSFTGYILISGVTFEEGQFASPYTLETRSNTESIIDLVGTNILVAASLTYNSDNTFNFSGSSNYINVPNSSSLDLVNNITLVAWMKFTTSDNTVCIEKSNNNSHYQFQIMSGGQVSGGGGQVCFMLQPNPANWVTTGGSNNDGLWHCYVGTYDRSTSTAQIYVDGLLKNTNAAIATGPTSNTHDLLIGSRSGGAGFLGSISVCKIYSRTLSATEVSQNFNAMRGRYGI